MEANPCEKLAHHFHYPAQIIEAVKRGVPAVVLLRNPIDAVASYVIREENISIGEGMDYYIDFHRYLLGCKGSFVIGCFEEVVDDFGVIINRVNDLFSTNFTSYKKTTNAEENVHAAIKYWDEIDSGGDSRKIGSPSSHRNEMKKNLLLQIGNNENLQKKLDVANSIYMSLLT
jgi:hypothetical protein